MVLASCLSLVIDSGFCVLQALVELAKVGVFAHALVKKRRYWPKHVPGDKIIEHFKDKAVGYVDARQGNLDGIPFYLYGMKEPDYTMIMMATYGTLQRMGPEKHGHSNSTTKKQQQHSSIQRLCQIIIATVT